MRSLCVLVFASCFSANLFADIVDSGAGFASAIMAQACSNTCDLPTLIIVSTSPSLTYSNNQSAVDGGTGSVNVSISSGNGNVALHGSATSDAPSGSQANAAFDLYWYDQLNITGTGPETFQYTLTLDGSAGLNPSTAAESGISGGLSIYTNASYQTWGTITDDPGFCGFTCGAIPFSGIGSSNNTFNGSTVTGDVTFLGGQSIELGLYLWARTGAYNFDTGSNNILAEFNASDTGYFTLTPITPGAGFTTASGLTYAANPDVATPEPAYTVLCGLGFVGALGFRRFWKNSTRAVS
jgi:hypothetical protein